ncbi:MAG TPA: hypothetical protein VD794_09210, partial [Flavisolibacter sp.]|nr:hypothetical protein [Flavisolibacter sp.]
LFISAQKDSTYFTRVENAVSNKEVLGKYTGDYYSEEVEGKVKIILENDGLVLIQRPGSKQKLIPTFRDGFDGPGSALYFKRDKGDKITGFYISISRARNVWFQLVNK